MIIPSHFSSDLTSHAIENPNDSVLNAIKQNHNTHRSNGHTQALIPVVPSSALNPELAVCTHMPNSVVKKSETLLPVVSTSLFAHKISKINNTKKHGESNTGKYEEFIEGILAKTIVMVKEQLGKTSFILIVAISHYEKAIKSANLMVTVAPVYDQYMMSDMTAYVAVYKNMGKRIAQFPAQLLRGIHKHSSDWITMEFFNTGKKLLGTNPLLCMRRCEVNQVRCYATFVSIHEETILSRTVNFSLYVAGVKKYGF